VHEGSKGGARSSRIILGGDTKRLLEIGKRRDVLIPVLVLVLVLVMVIMVHRWSEADPDYSGSVGFGASCRVVTGTSVGTGVFQQNNTAMIIE
jgi:hypothetical protein